MKKKVLILAALVLTLVCTLCASAFVVSAEEAEPSVTIAKFNLAFEDNTYLKYAVRFDGVADSAITANNIGMLYWLDYADGFAPGTEDFSSKTTGYTEIGGVKHYVFEYTRLAAKQLTDYVYSVAYLEYEGEVYYSAPVKYSALEYAYNRLGKTSEGTDNAELKALLTNMLAYGASAQQYFDYKEDRLATDDFYQVKVVGGLLEDGFDEGLYLCGNSFTISAPETVDGSYFRNWSSDSGIASQSATDTLTMGAKGVTYTANYADEAYLAKLNEDIELVLALNQSLASTEEKPTSIGVALAIITEAGYDVSMLDARAEDNEILWDSVNGVFCYLNNGVIEYFTEISDIQPTANEDYWIVDNEVNDVYSTYLVNCESALIEVKHNIDVTACPGIDVVYNGSSDITVITNGGNIIITDPDATVNHYGTADSVIIGGVNAA